ncbi:MAG: alpha/beta fold hydrolase, partial [Henriciella sp.]
LSIVRKKKIPITVLRPTDDSVMTNKVTDRLIRKVPAAIVKDCPNTGHFLPMEAPYAVRDQLSQFISSLIEGMDETETNPMRRSLQP